MGGVLRCIVVVASSLALVATSSPPAAAAPLEPWMQPGDPGWLTKVNYFRAWSGLPPVVEDTDLSYGDYLHARYTAENGVVAHTEDPASAWYTDVGAAAAAVSNVAGTAMQPIEAWMAAPFHAIGILRPALARVGFGTYRSSSGREGAALDIISGLDGPPANEVVTFPGDGSQLPLNGFGGEFPDPTAGCPGTTHGYGLPLIAMFGAGHDTLDAASLLDGHGRPVAICTWDATTFVDPGTGIGTELGRTILGGDGSVLLIPLERLEPGQTYTASATADGDTVEWSFTVGVARLAGADRFETAAAIAASDWEPGSGTEVVVASGRSFADALAGGALAAHLGGPLLLTEPCALPSSVSSAIKNLEPSAVVVVGGPAAICDAVVDRIEGLGVGGVERVAGATRFDTAASVAERYWPHGASGAVVASGRDFPDGLAGGAAAGRDDEPLLLVDRCELPASTAEQLTRLGSARIRVLGGTVAICEDVDAAITNATGVPVQRIAGVDRYDTAARLALASEGGGDGTAYVASGTSFADGLALAALAAHRDAPLLLIPGAETVPDHLCDQTFWTAPAMAVPPPVGTALAARAPTEVVVAGGPAAVCDGILGVLAYRTGPG